MLENEFPSLGGVIAFQKPLLHVFSSPSWLLGFPCPFTFKPKEILAKRKFSVNSPRFEPNANVKPMHNPLASSCFVIIPINIGLNYHSL